MSNQSGYFHQMYYGRFNLLQLCRPVSGDGPLVAAGNFRSFWLPLLLLLLPHHLYQYTSTAVCLLLEGKAINWGWIGQRVQLWDKKRPEGVTQ